jgi:hypothetical protein
MAEQRKKTSSKGAGNATAYSSSTRQGRGVSGVRGVKAPTNPLDSLGSDLDNLIGIGRLAQSCTVQKILDSLDEPLKSKLQSAIVDERIIAARLTETLARYNLKVSSDVMRRHRRRMLGKDGCSCPVPKITE